MRSLPDSAVRLVSLVAFGGLAWLLLGCWIEGGSERFYLLVPPLGLTLIPCLSVHGWSRLRSRLVPLGGCVAGLGLLLTGYYVLVTWDTSPGLATGLRAFNLLEVMLAGYFVLSILILVAGSYGCLRFLISRLHDRLLGRSLLREGLLLVLAVVLGVPYLMGAFYVHRLKIPNTTTPLESVGRPFEDVAFVSADGFTLRGWFIPAEQPSPRTLLICHGLGANRSLFLPYLKVGRVLHSNVLMFDFRGHGESDGHTVSLGWKERRDVLAALQYLRRQRPGQARAVIGLGVSMGAASLVGAAAEAEVPFDGIILDSGFASVAELTDQVLQLVPVAFRSYLAGLGLPLASLDSGCWLPEVRPEDEIARLRAPVLIIHAQEDALIPANHATRLSGHALEPKALWLAPTRGHGSALFQAEAEYLQTVLRWDREVSHR